MSNRLFLLKTDIRQALSAITHGSPSFRREREKTLGSLPGDLMALNALVPRLKDIRLPLLKKLIQLWQSRGNTPNTVCRKISILRRVMTTYIDFMPFPDNSILGILYEKAIITLDKQHIDIHSIRHQDVQLVCRLQACFGLKKQEAIRFERFMLAENEFRLSREASYNNQNRTIPYWNDAQKKLVDDLKQLPVNGFRQGYENLFLLSSLHTNEFKQQKIYDKEHFRHIYLYERYRHLNQNSTTQSTHESLKKLRDELGYADNRKIKAILTCRDVF